MTNRVLVGRRADKDVPDVLRVDISVLTKFEIDLLIESVDEKVILSVRTPFSLLLGESVAVFGFFEKVF